MLLRFNALQGWGQVKTSPSLRLKVALGALAQNLKLIDPMADLCSVNPYSRSVTPGLRPGDPVTVTFDPGAPTLSQARAHGRYRLQGMPATTLVMVSFARQDRDPGERAGQDGEEQLWGASSSPCPEAWAGEGDPVQAALQRRSTGRVVVDAGTVGRPARAPAPVSAVRNPRYARSALRTSEFREAAQDTLGWMRRV